MGNYILPTGTQAHSISLVDTLYPPSPSFTASITASASITATLSTGATPSETTTPTPTASVTKSPLSPHPVGINITLSASQ